MDTLAKTLGVDIYVFESYVNKDGKRVYMSDRGEKKAPNGFYDPSDGSIHIDLNAGQSGHGTMLFTVAHELTHFIKDWSSVKYRAMADMLVKQYQKQGVSVSELVDNQIDKAKQNGRELSRPEAFDEVVADSMESMLSDENAAAFLDRLAQRDKCLKEKVVSWLKELAAKLKNALTAYKDVKPDSPEGKMVAEMEDFRKEIMGIYTSALVDAGENFRENGGNKNTTREGGVKMQERSEQYDYSKPFSEQVEDYKNNLIPKGDSLIVGATPEIWRNIGFNALPVSINTTHIDYALNGTKDADHYLGEYAIKQLPQSIKDPVAVFVSQTQPNTSVVALLKFKTNRKQTVAPVLIDGFGKQNGIIIDSNAITSVFGKTNSVSKLLYDAINEESNGKFSVLYWDKKEAISLLQRAGLQLPGTLMPHDGFIHSIRESSSPVKMKFGSVTETQQFKRWFGDWQKHPNSSSKVVNADGTPMVVYHQTGNEFSVFDPMHSGAGSSDNQTPFGIFLKSSDKDIGINGKKQMALYANIRNPLRALNRNDLTKKLKRLSPDYDALCVYYDQMNAEFQKKQESAGKTLEKYMAKWRKENPTASRRAIYDDETFINLSDEEDKVIDLWVQKDQEISREAKNVITKSLRDAGYDGVFISEDTGSFGRKTDAIIALDPEQVKSATDNLGTYDGKNKDIYFSDRDPTAEATRAALEKENGKLREDVSRLRELLRLQGKVTGGTVMKQSSIEAAARWLNKYAWSKADVKELSGMLKDFYSFLATEKDYSWEDVRERAMGIAKFLQDNVQIKPQISDYARDVLREVRGIKIKALWPIFRLEITTGHFGGFCLRNAVKLLSIKVHSEVKTVRTACAFLNL